jgi:hypothetical protein
MDERAKNTGQLFIAVNSFTIQMADTKRLEITCCAAD